MHKRLDALLYFESILSSIYSGVSTVGIKIFVDSLSDSTISHTVLVIGLAISFTIFAVTSILNVATLNHLLSLYPSLKVVPCYQASIIVGTILCGGIFLDEFYKYNLKQAGIILFGVCFCVVGLYYK